MIELLEHYGLLAACAFCALGGVYALVFSALRKETLASIAAHAGAALGGLIGVSFSLAMIFGGAVLDITLPSAGLTAGFFHVRVDALAAFFIALISAVTVAASIYGIAYQRQFYGVYRLGFFGFFYNLFIIGMLLVVSAYHAGLFLFSWELMAISSYFLVVFERRHAEHVRAGTLYIVISQAGAAFLFAAFLLWQHAAGSLDFGALSAAAASMPPALMLLISALALIGIFTKAGVIPLHVWLPEAHPAAPSHVSALMSGVMIKTAIFMMIRIFLDLIPGVSAYWGLGILAFGAISALLGVLYALSEHDLKRLLAFHSVENIGIILLGIGSSIVFFAYDIPVAGVVALAAALFHTLNHALFKSLLFLSGGAVAAATGTRNMEEHGGILRRMPWTGAFFLLGAAAISGLPPLNGFASEWLTFQGLIAGIALLPIFPKIIFLASFGALILTSGLAAACFVKAFGAVFLARPRSEEARSAKERGPLALIPMGALALLIVLFGVGAGSAVPVLTAIAASVRGLSVQALPLYHPGVPIALGNFASLSMLSAALIMATSIVAALLFVALVARGRSVRIGRTWDCGAPLTPRMEITATGFSRSLITIFRGLLRPTMQSEIIYRDAATRYFVKTSAVHLSLPDLYRAYFYRPLSVFIERAARRAGRIQSGNLNLYLLYMFATLFVLLFWSLKTYL